MDLVVAKYKEDVSWLSRINANYIVYDKSSGQLPNIGREAHTYVYHIVNNYDSLSEWTAFVQGKPFDHCQYLYNLINDFDKIAEQNNKHEDIRDRDNHCYDALKYAMTFLADLAPDNVEEPQSTRQFHDTFREAFKPVHQFSDYDDSDDWGPSWNGSTTMRQLEGN